jgi:hypothetical protein
MVVGHAGGISPRADVIDPHPGLPVIVLEGLLAKAEEGGGQLKDAIEDRI